MYPTPSPERSMAQRLWRARSHDIDVVPAQQWINLDRDRKMGHQETMTNSPNFLAHLSETPPPKVEGVRKVPRELAPLRHEAKMKRSEMLRRNSLMNNDPDLVNRLFPVKTGMSLRPDIVTACQTFTGSGQGDFLFAHFSCDAQKNLGKKMHGAELDEARNKSLMGKKRDMSLMTGGVKKVPPPIQPRAEDVVVGFKQMGAYSVDPRRTGKGLVEIGEYDPLGIFKECGRRWPAPAPANRR